MKNPALRAFVLTSLVFVFASGLFAQARMVSKFGRAQVNGQPVIVHVTVGVPPGVNANNAAIEALRAQGARPFDSSEFTTTGLVWDQFFDDPDINPDFMTQNYNPSNDPTGNGLAALQATHGTWNGVTDSSFAFQPGDTNISRCPSLVRECPGKQTFDGLNDVAWVALSGPWTLAVTWYGTSLDEADMAMNTKFTWNTNGTDDFDVETVVLHENGHALGLGHSSEILAVMYASYQGIHPYLHQDDIDGVVALYPGTPPDPCVAVTEICDDGIDNDCDDLIDDFDPDCNSCSDSVQGGTEECDGTDLAGEDCVSLGFDGGTLSCGLSCTFDDSACTSAVCDLGQVDDSCSSNSECCSNKCTGKPGSKRCK